jgi:hypothetical protein
MSVRRVVIIAALVVGRIAIAAPPAELVVASHDDTSLVIAKLADAKVVELLVSASRSSNRRHRS